MVLVLQSSPKIFKFGRLSEREMFCLLSLLLLRGFFYVTFKVFFKDSNFARRFVLWSNLIYWGKLVPGGFCAQSCLQHCTWKRISPLGFSFVLVFFSLFLKFFSNLFYFFLINTDLVFESLPPLLPHFKETSKSSITNV